MNTESETVVLLDPKKVLVSKQNTRQPKATNPSIMELMESIRSTGQISPAIVRPHPKKEGHYELAAGARRKVACEALKRPLRAIVREIPDDEFEDMILTDNLQREDPDPMQEAILIERRLKAGVAASEIAARYGKSELWIKRRMKLASLTPQARDAWAEGGAFFHFNTEMMEYVGTLPPEVQNDLADDPYATREWGSLKEMLEGQKHDQIDLEGVEWLHDPATFVDGCGPGCATNTAESLFPDPENPCGSCVNGDCFRKRQALARDAKITALLDGKAIGDFVLVKSEGYGHGLTYQGKDLKALASWEMSNHYTRTQKPGTGTVAAIDFAKPDEPRIIHLKRKNKDKGANGSTPGKQESREDKLTAKRLARMQELLVEHLEKAPLPTHVPMLHLVAAFGTVRNRNTCESEIAFNEAWGSYHTDPDVKVPGLGWRDEFGTREEVLWEAIKPILRQRLAYQKNSELAQDHKTAEMRQTAALTGFPWETHWKETCITAVPVPKSWGPGIDPVTLKTAAQMQAERKAAAKAVPPALKRKVAKKLKESLKKSA